MPRGGGDGAPLGRRTIGRCRTWGRQAPGGGASHHQSVPHPGAAAPGGGALTCAASVLARDLRGTDCTHKKLQHTYLHFEKAYFLPHYTLGMPHTVLQRGDRVEHKSVLRIFSTGRQPARDPLPVTRPHHSQSHVRTRFEDGVSLHAKRCTALKESCGFHKHRGQHSWVKETQLGQGDGPPRGIHSQSHVHTTPSHTSAPLPVTRPHKI